MGAPLPPVIPEPFANAADPAFINVIPDTTATPGAASYELGFPPLTMQPVAAGGKPPFGQDVNGILFALSSHDYFTQAGQTWPYNASVATAIGGYAVGSILGSTDGVTVWFNTVAANMTDPDGGSAAGWVSLFAYGYTTINSLTGGTRTLTPQEAGKKVIILNGTLTSNLALVIPLVLKDWLIVNNTTGAFTTTVRGPTGTGQTVPQGGFANPLGVYTNGTNVYPTVAPLGVPISQGADPLTLAQRTNVGNINAAFFHTTAPAEAAGGISNVYCEGAGLDQDGLIRKFTLAYFESVMDLAAIGGAVTAGQVPQIAVTQHKAAVLASAALTGTPTAPTAVAGTSTTQVATTAYANPAQSQAANGYVKFPGGVILQWGSVSVANATGQPVDVGITFPIPFPSACVGVHPTTFRSVAVNGQATSGSNFCGNITLSGATITIDQSGGGLSIARWFAIGF